MVGRTKARNVRTARPCPTCGKPARAAYYRGERDPGSAGGAFVPIHRTYCASCDKLLPREKDK